jgi:hypothetical protein
MMSRWWLGAVLLTLVGCSDAPKVAPVSGKVLLNGKPLANATVTFSPIAKPGEVNAGDGSVGQTNDKGEYTLTNSRGLPGAQVGSHRIRISVIGAQAGNGDERRSRVGPAPKDPVPLRYNAQSALTFDVTSGGTNQADFELTSP